MSSHTDQLWLSVEIEADNAQQRNAGLWARCFAQAEGNASKAKALYMTERVRQLSGSVELSKASKSSTRWLLYIFWAIVFFVAFLLIVASRFPEDASVGQRAAIEICWRDQKNPALDETTKRFVATTCQGMEADYRRQHGRHP